MMVMMIMIVVINYYCNYYSGYDGNPISVKKNIGLHENIL